MKDIDQVRIPVWIASTLLAAAVSAQAWMLAEIIGLKGAVAGLAVRVEILSGAQLVKTK